MKYPFLFYVDKKSIAPNAGRTNAFIVRIAKEYKDDAGLLAHEMNHAKNWLLFGILAACVTYGLLAGGLLSKLGFALFLLQRDILIISGGVGFAFYGLAYVLIKQFRYNQEFQCYKIQLNTYQDIADKPRLANLFAGFIKNSYNNCTSLSQEEIAQKLLKD